MTKTKARSFANYIDEVDSRLRDAAKKIDKKIAEQKRAYLGTNNRVLGLTVPRQKQLNDSCNNWVKISALQGTVVVLQLRKSLKRLAQVRGQ